MSEMSEVDWLPSLTQNSLPHNASGHCYAYGEDPYFTTPVPGSVIDNIKQETPVNSATSKTSKEGKPPYRYVVVIFYRMMLNRL